MRALAVLTVLLVSALAGCLAPNDPPADGPVDVFVPGAPTVRPDFDFAHAIEFEHDHSDAAVHGLDYGLRQVGHTDMTSASRPGTVPGQFNEVSIADNGIAVVANYGPHRVFSVVDVSDPTNPTHVSDWWASDPLTPQRSGASSAWGLTIFPEGDLVVVSLQAMANTPMAEGQQGGGLFLVNVEDPATPVQESFTSVSDPEALIPVGVHTVRVFTLEDGTRYVAASTANGITILYRVEGAAPARTLTEVSRVKGMHDTTVQVHPITGQRLIYGADAGVVITDITDPAKPEILSQISEGVPAYHQVVPMDVLIEGRHYTVSATENAEGMPTPFTLLDTTDPADPVVVSQWRLPLELPTEAAETSGNAYRYTGHNVDMDRGRLYIGHSHAGVWVLDISSAANAAEPFPIAFYQPHEDVLLAGPVQPFATVDVPAVWSAYRHTDGYVYVADGNTGLYVLEVTEPPSPYEDAPVWPHNVR